MSIYLVILLTVTAAYYGSEKAVNRYLSNGLQLLSSFILVLFAGLRNRSVGTDSGTYISMFSRRSSSEGILERAQSTGELGWELYLYLLRSISDEYWLLFGMTAVVVVSCYFRMIEKLSSNKVLSVFLFVCLGFFTFSFNGTRQGIAAAFLALSLAFIVRRRPFHFLGLCVLAALFHKSALLFVPVYLLNGARLDVRYYAVLAALFVLGVALYADVISLVSGFDERYVGYLETGKLGGVVTSLFWIAQALILIWLRQYIHRNREIYTLYLKILLISVVISGVTIFLEVNPSGLLRLNLYFCLPVLLIWPIVFENIRDKGTKLFGLALVCAFSVAFYYFSTTAFSKLVPYTVNPLFAFL
jgi:hypothetical protein